MPDLVPPVPNPRETSMAALTASLESLVKHPDYPCLGAKSVFRRGGEMVRVYPELGQPNAAESLMGDLSAFADMERDATSFASFIAIFRGPDIESEPHFEKLLWRQLRLLADLDESEWNEKVSSDPLNTHFAFSLRGTAFFVVGLHPRASRDARRAGSPVLVFNLHEQFEQLRRDGRYARMRDTIRSRDARLQGSINPMVGDHGESSEARQYSGRAVGATWRPPLHEDVSR